MALKNVKNKFYFADVEKNLSMYLNCFFLFFKKNMFHLLFPTLLNLDLYRGCRKYIANFYLLHKFRDFYGSKIHAVVFWLL